jgi:CheY-like chemotaxis protein
VLELLHSLQNEQKEGIHNQRIDLSRIKSNTSGVKCEISTNGREGIEKFSSSASGYYDVILMDLRMPVMGGREATMVTGRKIGLTRRPFPSLL